MTLAPLPSALARLLVASAVAILSARPGLAAFPDPVSVKLVALGGVTFDGVTINSTPVDESALVDPALGLHAGDPGNAISGFWMLPNESITFAGNSIFISVAAGAQMANGDLMTGYLGSGAERARYHFDGLTAGNEKIVGADLAILGGVTGGAGRSFSAHGLDFYLDSLKLVDPGKGTGDALGRFRIDLQLAPVPEPGSWALIAMGLGVVMLRRRSGSG